MDEKDFQSFADLFLCSLLPFTDENPYTKKINFLLKKAVLICYADKKNPPETIWERINFFKKVNPNCCTDERQKTLYEDAKQGVQTEFFKEISESFTKRSESLLKQIDLIRYDPYYFKALENMIRNFIPEYQVRQKLAAGSA